KSLDIARKVTNPKGEALSLMNLGLVYKDWGQYGKAVEYYEKSLELKRKLGNFQEEGRTLINLGEVYRASGDYDKALASSQKGLEIYEKIGVPTGWPKDSIGNLYLDKGDITKAEPFIRQGGEDYSLGRLSLLRSDYVKAREYYEKDRQYAEKTRQAD